ncbi:MAG: SCO family protein [Anaerolineales bacterium]|nr:SCO family protein [Anaerolineales bacterium]
MNKNLLWTGLGIIVLLAIVAIFSIFFAQPPAFRGTSYAEPFPLAPEIDLTKADGTEFRLSNGKGKVHLIFFGYTSCPDFCPTTLAEMKLLMDTLGSDAENVQVLFITVDPEKDTSERIQEYVSRFNTNFIGLSGAQAELQPIWQGYGIFREVTNQSTALGTIINHTVRLYLVDLDGNLRLSYAYGTPYQDVVFDIKILLDEAK